MTSFDHPDTDDPSDYPYYHSEPVENPDQLEDHPDAPSRGWPGMVYRTNRLFRRRDPLDPRYVRAPEPNWKEQADRSNTLINAWCDVVPACVFAVVNTKGGSAKTPTITNAATLFAQVTGSAPLLIDANPASGTSGQKVGRDYFQTITVYDLYKLIHDHPDIDAVELQKVMKKTRYGLRVVSADPLADPDRQLFHTHWNAILKVLTKKFAYIFIDMGNDINHDIGAQTLLKDWVDVFLVTANTGDRRHPEWGIPESIPQMAKTEAIMLQNIGVHPLKIVHALGVLSNGRPEEIQDYLDRAVFLGPDREIIARHEGLALVVPHDPYLSSPRFNEQGVNLEALQPATVEAYRQVLIAAMHLRHQMLEQLRAQPEHPSSALSAGPTGRPQARIPLLAEFRAFLLPQRALDPHKYLCYNMPTKQKFPPFPRRRESAVTCQIITAKLLEGRARCANGKGFLPPSAENSGMPTTNWHRAPLWPFSYSALPTTATGTAPSWWSPMTPPHRSTSRLPPATTSPAGLSATTDAA